MPAGSGTAQPWTQHQVSTVTRDLRALAAPDPIVFTPAPADTVSLPLPDNAGSLAQGARGDRRAHSRRRTPRFYSIDSQWARISKRTVDLAVGVPLAAVFAVVYPVVAVILKLTSPGPVLFRQQRVGRGGKLVTIYKFRSMHVDAEERLRSDSDLYRAYLANGFKIPSDADPRITSIGRFLRRSSLDELPQAICLIRGDMTVVGPRPVLPEELSTLHGPHPEHYLVCKPGLTGLWQVSGRSHVVDEGRAKLDEQYAVEWSLRGDLSILARTIPAVLSAHGAH